MRIFVCAALVAALLIPSAQAQQACGPREAIVKRLTDIYQESRYAAGIAANGDLVEIFAAVAGTWTVMITRPGGATCVVAVGDHWQGEADAMPPRHEKGT